MIQSIVAFILLAIAIGCYSISQLAQHQKLKWGKEGTGFWGFDSDKRKYTSKIPFAKTALVFLTDGYHLMQFFFLLLLSLSFTISLGLENWWPYLVYIGVHIVHFLTYKLLSK